MERLNCDIKDILSAWLDGNYTNNCSSDLCFVVGRRRDDPQNIIGVILTKLKKLTCIKLEWKPYPHCQSDQLDRLPIPTANQINSIDSITTMPRPTPTKPDHSRLRMSSWSKEILSDAKLHDHSRSLLPTEQDLYPIAWSNWSDQQRDQGLKPVC